MTGCGVQGSTTQAVPPASGIATAVAIGHFSPPSRPRTLIGPGRLTVAEDGTTVRLSRGESVTADLAAQGMFSWHVPVVAGTAVRQVTNSGGYPTDQPALATFVATEPGTAVLTSTDDTACRHAHPACLPPQQQWRVTIIVG